MRTANKIYTLEEGLEIMDAIIEEGDTSLENDVKEYVTLSKKFKGLSYKTSEYGVLVEEQIKLFSSFKEKYGEDALSLLKLSGESVAQKLEAINRGSLSSSRIGKYKKSTGCYGIEA